MSYESIMFLIKARLDYRAAKLCADFDRYLTKSEYRKVWARATKYGMCDTLEYLRDRSMHRHTLRDEQIARAITESCEINHVHMLKMLLTDEQLIIYDIHTALRSAYRNNYTRIIKILMQFYADKYREALEVESYNFTRSAIRHLGTMQLFMSANIDYGNLISWLHHSESTDMRKILKLFLKFGINPGIHRSYAFRIGCENDWRGVIKMLLTDDRVDPTEHDNDALYVAARKNRIEITEILLNHPKVEPSDSDNRAIKWARKMNNHTIINMLERHSRFVKLKQIDEIETD